MSFFKIKKKNKQTTLSALSGKEMPSQRDLCQARGNFNAFIYLRGKVNGNCVSISMLSTSHYKSVQRYKHFV